MRGKKQLVFLFVGKTRTTICLRYLAVLSKFCLHFKRVMHDFHTWSHRFRMHENHEAWLPTLRSITMFCCWLCVIHVWLVHRTVNFSVISQLLLQMWRISHTCDRWGWTGWVYLSPYGKTNSFWMPQIPQNWFIFNYHGCIQILINTNLPFHKKGLKMEDNHLFSAQVNTTPLLFLVFEVKSE